MPASILDGLALVDPIGRLILGATAVTLVSAVLTNLALMGRYARLEAEIDGEGGRGGRFESPVLADVVREVERGATGAEPPATQTIIEERFQSGLRASLVAERFVRSAVGLVIILGLLGTFYGLTSSIGRLVQLVAGDSATAADPTLGVTAGLTHALSGMAVAFSNSLVGIVSAVVLTILGIFSNPTDKRVALMLRFEAYLERLVAERRGAQSRGPDGFAGSVERLEAAVARFDGALQAFSASARDFSEFNAHLKDNVQRMSLSFGDLNDALKAQIATVKRENGR